MKLRISLAVWATGIFIFFAAATNPNLASAQIVGEPNWVPYIVGSQTFRSEIHQVPIVERPNRPFHFYGNTVRRDYYRGSPIPMPRDWVNTAVQPWIGRSIPSVSRRESRLIRR
ncbi:MAG: hypothetical protein R3C03_03760 [Pirellulaceae bacterium]